MSVGGGDEPRLVWLSDLVTVLEEAVEAEAHGDPAGFARCVDTFRNGVLSTAGELGGPEPDYVLRNLAAALDLGEPDDAAAARIADDLVRLRGLGL